MITSAQLESGRLDTLSYAWLMVAVTFFTQFLCMGFTFYSFGVVLKPLAEEFGGNRLGVTLLPLAMSLSGGVMAPLVGRWIARGSIRNIMLSGCIATSAGFLLGSRATDLWQLALLYGTLLTFGTVAMAGIAAQALVVNWFEENRAMALGISLMGISLSGVVMAHVATWLVHGAGWRGTFEVFGWACLCAAPVVGWLVVGHPGERDGGGATAAAVPIGTRAALRDRKLWIIAGTVGLAFMATTAILQHAIAFSTDAGLSGSQAAWVLSVLAGGAAAGKLVFGWLAQRIGERAAFFVALAAQGFGTLGLLGAPPFGLLLAVSVLLGLGMGGVMPLAAALIARVFGPASFGPMMGLMMPILIPFQSLGSPFAGWVFDSTGSYDPAWWTFVVVAVLAAALLSRLRLAAPGAISGVGGPVGTP